MNLGLETVVNLVRSQTALGSPDSSLCSECSSPGNPHPTPASSAPGRTIPWPYPRLRRSHLQGPGWNPVSQHLGFLPGWAIAQQMFFEEAEPGSRHWGPPGCEPALCHGGAVYSLVIKSHMLWSQVARVQVPALPHRSHVNSGRFLNF